MMDRFHVQFTRHGARWIAAMSFALMGTAQTGRAQRPASATSASPLSLVSREQRHEASRDTAVATAAVTAMVTRVSAFLDTLAVSLPALTDDGYRYPRDHATQNDRAWMQLSQSLGRLQRLGRVGWAGDARVAAAAHSGVMRLDSVQSAWFHEDPHARAFWITQLNVTGNSGTQLIVAALVQALTQERGTHALVAPADRFASALLRVNLQAIAARDDSTLHTPEPESVATARETDGAALQHEGQLLLATVHLAQGDTASALHALRPVFHSYDYAGLQAAQLAAAVARARHDSTAWGDALAIQVLRYGGDIAAKTTAHRQFMDLYRVMRRTTPGLPTDPEQYLDQTFQQLVDRGVPVTRVASTGTHRMTVAEYKTGLTCFACWFHDRELALLLQHYPSDEFVVLSYQYSCPPLSNEVAPVDTRLQAWYPLNPTDTTTVRHGTLAPGSWGAMKPREPDPWINGLPAPAEHSSPLLTYQHDVADVDSILAMPPEAALRLTVTTQGPRVRVALAVDSVRATHHRVVARFVLMEDTVRMRGATTRRLHYGVVRAASQSPGLVLGVPLTFDAAGKASAHYTFWLDSIQAQYTNERTLQYVLAHRSFPSGPLKTPAQYAELFADMFHPELFPDADDWIVHQARLHVVAFVQDLDSGEILQAVMLPLDGTRPGTQPGTRAVTADQSNPPSRSARIAAFLDTVRATLPALADTVYSLYDAPHRRAIDPVAMASGQSQMLATALPALLSLRAKHYLLSRSHTLATTSRARWPQAAPAFLDSLAVVWRTVSPVGRAAWLAQSGRDVLTLLLMDVVRDTSLRGPAHGTPVRASAARLAEAMLTLDTVPVATIHPSTDTLLTGVNPRFPAAIMTPTADVVHAQEAQDMAAWHHAGRAILGAVAIVRHDTSAAIKAWTKVISMPEPVGLHVAELLSEVTHRDTLLLGKALGVQVLRLGSSLNAKNAIHARLAVLYPAMRRKLPSLPVDLEVYLDHLFQDLVDRDIPVTRYAASGARRRVVLEYGTGLNCAPCWYKDRAVAALRQRYPATELITLGYQMWGPPVSNEVELLATRLEDWYGLVGFPQTPHPTITYGARGPNPDALRPGETTSDTWLNGLPVLTIPLDGNVPVLAYDTFVPLIDHALSEAPGAALQLALTQHGAALQATLDVDSVVGEHHRLVARFVVVEDTLRLLGGTNRRLHYGVVRAASESLGLPLGILLTLDAHGAGHAQYSINLDTLLDEIRGQQSLQYVLQHTPFASSAAKDAYVEGAGDGWTSLPTLFPNPHDWSIDTSRLHMVAFVQDLDSSEILQAVTLPISKHL